MVVAPGPVWARVQGMHAVNSIIHVVVGNRGAAVIGGGVPGNADARAGARRAQVSHLPGRVDGPNELGVRPAAGAFVVDRLHRGDVPRPVVYPAVNGFGNGIARAGCPAHGARPGIRAVRAVVDVVARRFADGRPGDGELPGGAGQGYAGPGAAGNCGAMGAEFVHSLHWPPLSLARTPTM